MQASARMISLTQTDNHQHQTRMISPRDDMAAAPEPMRLIVAIVDFKCPYTNRLAAIVRELGHNPTIVQPEASAAWVAERDPHAIMLSGGNHSLFDETGPQFPLELMDLIESDSVAPVFATCYGMRWMARYLDCKFKNKHPERIREYGLSRVVPLGRNSVLFDGIQMPMDVMRCDGDIFTQIGPDLRITARAANQNPACIEEREGEVYGVSFHPAALDTPENRRIIQNFCAHAVMIARERQAHLAAIATEAAE